ncbi:unnamed protein product [Rotaria magnacalcarata]|uniref:Uncharacterized protein n=2 Tax=Rotaria magnacalcarata TaxID=392030 RepID=A0A8S3D6P8_9BILA|nr:unnamed protein product [Rotaria magnacalcarata]
MQPRQAACLFRHPAWPERDLGLACPRQAGRQAGCTAKLSKAAAAILITVIEYLSNMREALRKITPVIPSSVIFDIPETYQQTFSNERFLLVDLFMTHGKDRVLVCSSDQHLELLFESETIFMDGTFDTTPANFKQV